MANRQLAQHIADNQQLAAQTQQALRNHRRVIRHPVATNEPAAAAVFAAVTEATSALTPPAPAPEPPTAVTHQPSMSTLTPTFPPLDDIVDEVMPMQPPPTVSPASRPSSPAKTKKASNVVTLPNASITVSPLDLPTELFSAGLDRRKHNRHVLMQWLSSSLVDTVDYGRIHVVGKDRCQLARMGRMADCMEPTHWSKACLFKPGAEKISSTLGVTVHYPSLRDYESAVLAHADLHMIVLRCELRDAHGNVVAEGIGARDLKQDWGDVNKSLKMCAKSAHIDAVLRLAGISSLFTQDIEDRPPLPDHGDDSFDHATAAFHDCKPGKVSVPPTPTRGLMPAQGLRPTPAQPADTQGRSTVTASKTKRVVPSPTRPAITKADIAAIAITTANAAPAAGSPTTAVPATAERGDGNEWVSRADLVALRQAIVGNGFTERRVVSWLLKTTQGEVTTLEQLRKPQYASLLNRLNQWAADAQLHGQPPSPASSSSSASSSPSSNASSGLGAASHSNPSH